MTTWLAGHAGLIGSAAGFIGWLAAARFFWELRRWARQARGARIAVAYKRRVVLDAPILEWIQWANMLDEAEGNRGRVVYRGGHISVAILKPSALPTQPQVKVEKQT